MWEKMNRTDLCAEALFYLFSLRSKLFSCYLCSPGHPVFTCNKPLCLVKIVYFLYYIKFYYSWTVTPSIHLDSRLDKRKFEIEWCSSTLHTIYLYIQCIFIYIDFLFPFLVIAAVRNSQPKWAGIKINAQLSELLCGTTQNKRCCCDDYWCKLYFLSISIHKCSIH